MFCVFVCHLHSNFHFVRLEICSESCCVLVLLTSAVRVQEIKNKSFAPSCRITPSACVRPLTGSPVATTTSPLGGSFPPVHRRVQRAPAARQLPLARVPAPVQQQPLQRNQQRCPTFWRRPVSLSAVHWNSRPCPRRLTTVRPRLRVRVAGELHKSLAAAVVVVWC